jgi:PucR family transcriptional regulator, purine catabolism regulatory protein
MPEITLRDLCRWDRRMQLIPSSSLSQDAALDRGLSWVVSVRTAPPLLPPLRGEELVVISRRVLEQIENAEMITREQLLKTLSQQGVSAVLTEPSFSEEPLSELPMITMPAPFPQDAESTLNRLLTERRAELYRLGNDLSRRLSQAAMDPRGVEGILDVASELSGRPVVLQDTDGQLIASGGEQDPVPAPIDAIDQSRHAAVPVTVIDDAGLERLIVPMLAPTGSAFLSVSAAPGMLTEVDRLVLTQTAGTAAIVLAQGNAVGARSARQRAIAELLEGRLTSETAAIARARGLGIEAVRPIRVGLICADDHPALIDRTAEQLLGGLPTVERTEIDAAVVFLIADDDQNVLEQRLRRLEDRDTPDDLCVAIGPVVPMITDAADSLDQARFAGGLVRAGLLDGPVVRCDSLDDIGVFGLLYHLWGNSAVEQFREDVLGELQAYDERRGTELIATLRAYLSSGGSIAEASSALHVHRNTLSYRISRIGELSGRDLNDPNDRLLLRMALLCLDLSQVPRNQSR